MVVLYSAVQYGTIFKFKKSFKNQKQMKQFQINSAEIFAINTLLANVSNGKLSEEVSKIVEDLNLTDSLSELRCTLLVNGIKPAPTVNEFANYKLKHYSFIKDQVTYCCDGLVTKTCTLYEWETMAAQRAQRAQKAQDAQDNNFVEVK